MLGRLHTLFFASILGLAYSSTYTYLGDGICNSANNKRPDHCYGPVDINNKYGACSAICNGSQSCIGFQTYTTPANGDCMIYGADNDQNFVNYCDSLSYAKYLVVSDYECDSAITQINLGYTSIKCYKKNFVGTCAASDAGTPAPTAAPEAAPNSPAGSAANYKSQYDGGASSALGPVKGDAGRDKTGGNQNYADAKPNPTGASHGGRDPRREPHVSWSGDLDPKSRSLKGTVTIRPGMDARNLEKWSLYPTGDGTHTNRVGKHYADGSGSAGDKTAQKTYTLNPKCGATCKNNSPYSPTCTSTAANTCTETQYLVAHDGTKTAVTREKITILAGDSGEFYISRVQNQICDYGTTDYDPANKVSKDGTLSGSSVKTYKSDPAGGLGGKPTAGAVMNKRTCAGDTSEDHYRTSQFYDASEQAEITLPSDGWLTLVLHDFDSSATLQTSATQKYTDTETVNKATDVTADAKLSWSAGPLGRLWCD